MRPVPRRRARCSRRSPRSVDDLRVVKLNIDDNQQTAAAFEVLSIPTMILFRAASRSRKVIGAYPKKKIEAQLFE